MRINRCLEETLKQPVRLIGSSSRVKGSRANQANAGNPFKVIEVSGITMKVSRESFILFVEMMDNRSSLLLL